MRKAERFECCLFFRSANIVRAPTLWAVFLVVWEQGCLGTVEGLEV